MNERRKLLLPSLLAVIAVAFVGYLEVFFPILGTYKLLSININQAISISQSLHYVVIYIDHSCTHILFILALFVMN